MKKLAILLCVISMSTVAANAQNFGVWESFHNTHKNTKLSRVLDRLFTKPVKAPWLQTVEKQVRDLTPKEGRFMDTRFQHALTIYTQAPMTPQQREVVHAATQRWDKTLKQHPLPMYAFRFKVLRAQDILDLSPAEIARVEHLLSGAMDVNPQVQFYEHYIIGVTLPGTKAIHLLFNCFTREIYLQRGENALPEVPLIPLK